MAGKGHDSQIELETLAEPKLTSVIGSISKWHCPLYLYEVPEDKCVGRGRREEGRFWKVPF